MVFFKYIIFYILKTTRKYGKNLTGMCGRNCSRAQNMTADFREKKNSDCQNLSHAKFCVIFSGYMLLRK